MFTLLGFGLLGIAKSSGYYICCKLLLLHSASAIQIKILLKSLLLRKVVDVLVEIYVTECLLVSRFHFIAATYPKSGSSGLFLWAVGGWY